ncbi:MAG: HAD family hydrolase [Planctomycetota bacterium]
MAKKVLATARDVLAACDEALARAPAHADAARLVAFDADHTLWHADVGDLAWHVALAAGSFKPAAREAMAVELRLAGGTPSGDVHADARSLYALYKEDRVTEMSIVRAMTVCYAGWTEDEVRALGARLKREVLGAALYEGVVEIAQGLKDRGFRVVVVSGSPTWLVAEGVRGVLPLDPEKDVFGAEVLVAKGVLGATMREPITFFEGKVDALVQRIPGQRPSFAFGDSKGDLLLLHHAGRLAFAVNPRPQLRKVADEHERFLIFTPSRTVGGHVVRAPGTDRIIE